MSEENKELNLSDLGLEEEDTPADKVQKNNEEIKISKPVNKSKDLDNEIKVINVQTNENEEVPTEMVDALKRRKIPRPPKNGQQPPKSTIKRGGQNNNNNDGYQVVSIGEIAKNPISKPPDPVRDTFDQLYELTDKGINRTKNEMTAPGGRIDEAKHKYIEHNFAVLMNRAKNNTGLQNHIQAVNDIINSDSRFDGISDYERKAYILYKVAKDNETGISDESFGIKSVSTQGMRKSSAEVSKDVNHMIKSKINDDDDYLLDDNKAFILDDGGSNFAFKDDEPQEQETSTFIEEEKREEFYMDNEKVTEIKQDQNLESEKGSIEESSIKEDSIKEEVTVKQEEQPVTTSSSKDVKQTESEPKKEEIKEDKSNNEHLEMKPASPTVSAETTTPLSPKEPVDDGILTAENPEDDKSAMIEEVPSPEDEALENEKRQQNQKEFAKSVINMLELNKSHELDGFSISDSINLNTAIASQRRAPMTIKWGLQYTGTAFEMTPFSGEEIIQFSQDNTDFTSISGLRTIFSNIYRHLVIPNKPSFEAWLKQTSDYDVESLFFGIYISCFKDNNFLTYECPNKSCGKIYIEKRKIEEMVVYPNKETEARFKAILKGDTVSSKLYRTRPVPISEKYAIGFVTQSIWSNLFEPTSLSTEVANQYSTVVNLMPQIDRVYLIDRVNKQLKPINFGVLDRNLGGTVLRKVKGLNQIFRTFTMDERTKAFIEISKITSSFNNDRIRYQLPESTCPKCGTKIPAANHTPLDLLFIRSQLPIAAVSMQESV